MKRSHSHFRPYLTLEPDARAPVLIDGILQTWSALERGGEWSWYERSLPAAFRMNFAWVRGLEPYAVCRSESIPPALRSAAWKRLLSWKRRYGSLELEKKILLLKLLGMLGFYQDNDDLMRGDRALPRGPLTEKQSQYAYLKANNAVMLHELELKGIYSAMYETARRAAPGTQIRFLAAIKTMTLYAEHGHDHPHLHRAEAIAAKTLKRLESGASARDAALNRSRFWRSSSYLPFLRGDAKEVERMQALAESHAREAGAFGRDMLYGALATRASTSLRLKRPRRALAPLRELVAMDPLGAWQKFWLGMALYELGELEEARANFHAAYILAPPNKNKACSWLGRCLEKMGRGSEAATWRAMADRMTVPPAPPDRKRPR